MKKSSKAGKVKGLTRWQGIPLAIGSIAGSGILFLPSAVYARAGNNSLLVWALSTLLCLSMLLMFEDMVRSDQGGRSVEAFVRMGLGPMFGRLVPLMYIALVIVGLPSGAFIAGRYVAGALGAEVATAIIAGVILLGALAVNLAGIRASSTIQTLTTWGLILVATILLFSAIPAVRNGLGAVTPNMRHLGEVLPTLVLAFWAFTGFENLTFLAREFRNPERDFLLVCAIALSVYGVFTILLTVAIAVTVPRTNVDQVIGLLQLAAAVGHGKVMIGAVTFIAFSAMLMNSIAWVWGVSHLVRDAAENDSIPTGFAAVNQRDVPRRALGLLLGLFTITCIVLVIRPDLVVDATAGASAIFMLLYSMSIVSYMRVRGLTFLSAINLAPLAIIVVSLIEARWQALYGVLVFLVALSIQLIQQRRKDLRSRTSSPPNTL